MTRYRCIAIMLALALGVIPGEAVRGQAVDDPSRLTGITRIDVRVAADWDEAITNSAGGATPDQFRQALDMAFRQEITDAAEGPDLLDGAPVTVACHVDTFYETGLIIYSLRVQVERAGQDGQPVVTWMKSAVGSYTSQQMHLIFGLGTQCAKNFLRDWGTAN